MTEDKIKELFYKTLPECRDALESAKDWRFLSASIKDTVTLHGCAEASYPWNMDRREDTFVIGAYAPSLHPLTSTFKMLVVTTMEQNPHVHAELHYLSDDYIQ